MTFVRMNKENWGEIVKMQNQDERYMSSVNQDSENLKTTVFNNAQKRIDEVKSQHIKDMEEFENKIEDVANNLTLQGDKIESSITQLQKEKDALLEKTNKKQKEISTLLSTTKKKKDEKNTKVEQFTSIRQQLLDGTNKKMGKSLDKKEYKLDNHEGILTNVSLVLASEMEMIVYLNSIISIAESGQNLLAEGAQKIVTKMQLIEGVRGNTFLNESAIPAAAKVEDVVENEEAVVENVQAIVENVQTAGVESESYDDIALYLGSSLPTIRRNMSPTPEPLLGVIPAYSALLGKIMELNIKDVEKLQIDTQQAYQKTMQTCLRFENDLPIMIDLITRQNKIENQILHEEQLKKGQRKEKIC